MLFFFLRRWRTTDGTPKLKRIPAVPGAAAQAQVISARHRFRTE
jgi:hypothetical protein